ncbi:MAG: chitobiase/beta-hexosaminidase C-terminal domain-containing protein [Candidatus Acidiferrum sp.]
MRILLTALTLALLSSGAQAQMDPGAQAAQQATQQAIQANQQAIQAMQQSQLAAQQAMDASQASATSLPACCYLARKPKFSVKPGTYASPTKVKITDSTRGAIIYYTTDGWTPTEASQRYVGPVTLDSSTILQAVAIVPYFARSMVAKAEYKFNSPASAVAPSPVVAPVQANANLAAPPEKLVVVQGTPVRLAFAADVSSKTASVGDKTPLTLAEDLVVDGVVLAKKGTPASGTIIQVDKTGVAGQPGDLTIQADSLEVNGDSLRLRGTVYLEGQPKPPNAEFLIPVVGPAFLLKHGQNAEIMRGSTLTAFIYGDTSLPPAK